MKTRYIFLAALSTVMLGCARETTPSVGETAREYLGLWIEKYHPGVSPDANGLYQLEETVGTGDLWDADMPYSYLEITTRSLSGVVSSTMSEELSKQLGTYVVGNYYGPRFQATGEGSSYAGLDALLSGMREGGSRRAVVPAWMLTTSRFKTQKEYIDAASSSASLIYEVVLKGQTDDINAVEKDSIGRYVSRHYGAVDPVSYIPDEAPDGTFYFINVYTPSGEDVKPHTETATGTLNYTGRLLNGQVFDTTLENVAKDAGLYSSSKQYTPMSITFASEWKSISMGSGGSLIDGFKGALSLMKYPGQKAVAIFTSSQGYSTTGSGNTIPAWSPLLFELELVDVSEVE